MKILLTMISTLRNQTLLTAAFVFTFLMATSTLSIANINYTNSTDLAIEKEKSKMSIIPDSKEVNKAIVLLYSETTHANIVIFNKMGIVVFDENYVVDKMQENTIELDLTNLSSGTYYIVHDENKDSATYSVR